MTVQSKINEIPYIYNTAITKYDFPFKVLDADTIFVYIIEDDIETALEPIDDYDVDLYSDGKGFVTILKEDITNGVIITVKVQTTLSQPYSFDSPTYDRTKLEAALDNIAYATVDIENAINEDSIIISDELSTFNHTISNIIPGGLLVSDGTQLFIKKEVGFIGEGYVSNVSINNSGLIHKVGDVYKGVDFASFGSTRNLIVTKTVTDFSFALSANPWLDGLEGFIPPKGTTSQRIAAPKSIRFNTTLSQLEMSVDGVVFEAPIHTPESLTVFSGYLKIPSGTTAQRIAADNGLLRFNSTNSRLEVSNSTAYLKTQNLTQGGITYCELTTPNNSSGIFSFAMSNSLNTTEVLYPALFVITVNISMVFVTNDPYYGSILIYDSVTGTTLFKTHNILPIKSSKSGEDLFLQKDFIYFGNAPNNLVVEFSLRKSDFVIPLDSVFFLEASAYSQVFSNIR